MSGLTYEEFLGQSERFEWSEKGLNCLKSIQQSIENNGGDQRTEDIIVTESIEFFGGGKAELAFERLNRNKYSLFRFKESKIDNLKKVKIKTKRDPKIYSPVENEFIIKNWNTMPMSRIAKNVNSVIPSVYNHGIKHLKLKPKRLVDWNHTIRSPLKKFV